jgi:transposase-like protein
METWQTQTTDETEGETASERAAAASEEAVSAPTQFDQEPDPEVSGQPDKRVFTNEYKLRILAEADACEKSGELGALLRREGLYNSQLYRWRKRRDEGALESLSPQKRGPKASPPNPLEKKVRALERENERLRNKLRAAETIIDVQKKVSTLLGIEQTGMDTDESA